MTSFYAQQTKWRPRRAWAWKQVTVRLHLSWVHTTPWKPDVPVLFSINYKSSPWLVKDSNRKRSQKQYRKPHNQALFFNWQSKQCSIMREIYPESRFIVYSCQKNVNTAIIISAEEFKCPIIIASVCFTVASF